MAVGSQPEQKDSSSFLLLAPLRRRGHGCFIKDGYQMDINHCRYHTCVGKYLLKDGCYVKKMGVIEEDGCYY